MMKLYFIIKKRNDKCVLIGDEFWNFIGGEGTYEMFINEINALGSEYKEKIYTEYLGITPPEGTDGNLMK